MPCRVSGVQTELTQKDLLPKGRRSFLLRRAGGFVRSRPKQKMTGSEEPVCLVDGTGLEPVTSCTSSRCSTS